MNQVIPLSFNSNGLEVTSEKPTAEQWMATYNQVEVLKEASYWVLGDLLCLAELWDLEDLLPMEVCTKSPSTIAGWKQVARAFPKARRVPIIEDCPDLTYSHFRLVANIPIDSAEKWLRKASENKWSRKTLAQNLKPSKETDYSQYLRTKLLMANHVGETMTVVKWREQFYFLNKRTKTLFEAV